MSGLSSWQTSCGAVEQTVALQPNRAYLLSGYARVDFQWSGDEQARIGVKNFNGTQNLFKAITTPGYAQGTVTFTTGPTATSATIFCARTQYAVYGGYCDDLNVTLAQ